MKRKKYHGITGARTEVPEHAKKAVFLSAILRMKESGIASDKAVQEMAERVGGL
ncbi:MAG: hypothetical protein ABR585_12885 [Gemmatimonadaceae bacterium]|nr:hypothetical protein [Actinomycetota bacterium]